MKILPQGLNKMFDLYFRKGKMNPIEIPSFEMKEKIPIPKKEIRKYFKIINVRSNQPIEYLNQIAVLIRKDDMQEIVGRAIIYYEEDVNKIFVAKTQYKLFLRRPFNKKDKFFDYQLEEVKKEDLTEDIIKEFEDDYSKYKKKTRRIDTEFDEKKYAEQKIRMEEEAKKDPTKASKYKDLQWDLRELKFEGDILVKNKYVPLKGMMKIFTEYLNEKGIKKSLKLDLLKKEFNLIKKERNDWKKKFDMLMNKVKGKIEDKIFDEEIVYNILISESFGEMLTKLDIGTLVFKKE